MSLQCDSKYRTCRRRLEITPKRKGLISLSRWNYRATPHKIIKSKELKEPVISKEMRVVSSTSNPTILRDSQEKLKQFNWESLWSEFQKNLPILCRKCYQKPQRSFCFIISLILKNHCRNLSLVQKAVSVMLYGNGCHKQARLCIVMAITSIANILQLQIYRCLQPFMVCISPSATTNVIKQISNNHDMDDHLWKDSIK